MSSNNDESFADPPPAGSDASVRPSSLPEILLRLGLTDRPMAAPRLSQVLVALDDPRWYVRAGAIRDLEKLDASALVQAGPALLVALTDTHVSVRANAVLALRSTLSLERLGQLLLGDSEWQVRESAALALATRGREVSLAQLLAALHDPDLTVRQAVQQALLHCHPERDPSAPTGEQPQPRPLPEQQWDWLDRSPVPASGTKTYVLRKEKKMQDNRETHETIVYIDDAHVLPNAPRWSKGRRWRTVGLSMAVAVVVINLLAWGLLTHVRHGGSTQTGGARVTLATPSPTPTATLGPLGKTLFVYPPTSTNPPFGFSNVSWSATEKYISVASLSVALLNAENGKLVKTIDQSASATVWAQWSPDGERLLTSSNEAQIWNIATGQALVTFTPASAQASTIGHGNPLARLSGGNMIYASAWSPNSRVIASAVDGISYGYDVQLWNATTGAYMRTLSIKAAATPSDYIDAVGWSPDGRYLAASSPNNGVYVWNTSTWQLVSTKQGESELAWSPTGDLLATVNGSRVDVWQAATGALQYSFQGQKSSANVVTLAWSPDGRSLAVAGQDVRIWSVLHHKIAYIYTGFGTHSSFVINSLAWASDSSRLASMDTGMDITGSHTGTPLDSVRVWIAA